MFSIAAVLEHYGAEAVPDGTNRAIRCPFHDDRQASGSVDTYKELFNCHACGMAGTAVTLIMKQEGCGYETAVSRAKEIAGDGDEGVRGAAPKRRESSLLPDWTRDYTGGGGVLPPWLRS